MRIRTKLILTIGALVSILLISGVYSYMTNLNTHKSYKQVLNVQELRYNMKSIQFWLARISNTSRGYLLNSDETFINTKNGYIDSLHKNMLALKNLNELSSEDLQTIDKIEKNTVIYLDFSTKVQETFRTGDKDEALKLHFGEERAALKALDPFIADMLTMLDNQTKKQVANNTKRDVVLLGVIVVISLALGLVSTLIIYFSILKPMNVMQKRIHSIAQGNLAQEDITIKNKDEIGTIMESMNRMTQSLRSMIYEILGSAEGVAAAAQQISASTEEIASGSINQAAASQSMNVLSKELSIAINSVAENAEQAADLSGNALTVAREGGQVVRVSINEMNALNNQMNKLEEDSSKIGSIIEVIADIAGQTNLLALNAAIEAARAGDQGRGFAVVADEVRKLAERSGAATKQITQIIRGIQENTKISVKAVGNGVAATQQTGEAFERIIGMVGETTSKVMGIAAASEEQAAQATEVLYSIEKIASTSEEAAAAAEETAATSQSLAHLAEELSKSVSGFKLS